MAQSPYQPQPEMTATAPEEKNEPVTTVPPNPEPTARFEEGSWTHGFCSCFDDCRECCFAFWCPCVLFGYTHQRLHNPESSRKLQCWTGMCCGYMMMFLLCPGFHWIFSCVQRGEIRKTYEINGNVCSDCLAHCCCECCVFPPL